MLLLEHASELNTTMHREGGGGGGGEVTHRFFQIAQSLYVEEAEANPCLLQPHCPPDTATHTHTT